MKKQELLDYMYLKKDSNSIRLGEFVEQNLKFKNLKKYETIEIFTYDIELVRKPFIKALLLKFFAHKVILADNNEKKELKLRNLARVFFKQLLNIPYFVLKEFFYLLQFESKLKQKRRKNIINELKKVFYLRTDFWFGLKSGGSVAHTKGVIEAFHKLGIDVKVFSTDRLEYLDPSAKVDFVKPKMLFRDFPELPELEYNHQLLKYILDYVQKNGKPDFIYQRYSLNNYVGLKLSYILGIPLILEYNGSFLWMSRNWGRGVIFKKLTEKIEYLNLKYADLIVVVSKAMLNELVDRGIDPDKILINPNGVNAEKFNPSIKAEDLKQKYRLKNKLILGFIGTFGQWHGAENIVKSYGKLLQEHPEYKEKTRLFMIGDGVKMPEVKENIEKYNITDNVILTGLIPQEEAPKYLSVCDILINATDPNPDGSEFFGSPTKLFEYMAMGKAIISSDLGQMKEILENEKTALLVKGGDIDELKNAMKRLIDDKELRKTLGKNARKEVEEKYTWDKHVERILEKLGKLTVIGGVHNGYRR